MLRNFARGFRFALAGIKIAWCEEKNFKVEFVCAVLALALSLYLRVSAFEFALVTLAIGFVLTSEAFNTALEELCDKFSPTHDPHIAKIKDLAAAAVLIAALTAFFIGLFVFIPHL